MTTRDETGKIRIVEVHPPWGRRRKRTGARAATAPTSSAPGSTPNAPTSASPAASCARPAPQSSSTHARARSIGKALMPSNWRALPGLIYSLTQVIETNIPLWQLPRLLFALLRSVFFGVDSQTISRDMVTPFQTSAGAQVLAPNWDAINPLLKEMFGR